MSDKKSKILIIEDSSEMAKAILWGLSKIKDYEAYHASNGVSGLRMASEIKPDLILLDVELPGMSGHEVLAHLKKRSIPTRVIIMSAVYVTIDDIVYFVKEGACDYVVKPIDFENLLLSIAKALEIETTLNLKSLESSPLFIKMISGLQSFRNENKKLKKQLHIFSEKNRQLDEQRQAAKMKIDDLESKLAEVQNQVPVDLVKLANLIKLTFSLTELKHLCFMLNIEYENIPGRTLNERVEELVQYARRNGRLSDLIQAVVFERPHTDWLTILKQ